MGCGRRNAAGCRFGIAVGGAGDGTGAQGVPFALPWVTGAATPRGVDFACPWVWSLWGNSLVRDEMGFFV